ncbi:glycoside hydrolase family 15 protein [Angustibacter luteus]|uniref:Glycoside hydrolase family 15 n=1 Tax=Angustibacter luteus TaxID=658456 RepID=A0ABW1JB65_9ACTN
MTQSRGWRPWPRQGRRRRALFAALVAAVTGSLVWQGLLAGSAQSTAPLLTTSSWRVVTDPTGKSAEGAAAQGPTAENAWVAQGSDPGTGGRWADMTHWALVDLRQLSGKNGSMSAGAARYWSYTWPRDAAFAAAALARTGHVGEAWQMIDFLRSVQEDDGGFEARYRPDGTGSPDARERQSDGAAWALWGTAQVLAQTKDDDARVAQLVAHYDMVDEASDYLMRLTFSGTTMPPPGPDYWEVPTRKLTLGTAAPVLFGLRAAAQLYGELGSPALATRASGAADQYQRVLYQTFARKGFQRYPAGGGVDAAITFLMPPFVEHPRADVVRAWRKYQRDAERPAGGLAPGTSWKNDGISWTPEVGLVALTAAASGDQTRAEHWLDWLDWHRVPWGSLPEKVLGDGSPAGPAPLAWTASSVLIAVATLRDRGTG